MLTTAGEAPVVLVEKSGGIATVTLNRPTAMNALSRQLRSAIATTFEELEADPTVKVAILTGAGKAFCAGLDLKELGSGASTVGGTISDKDPASSIGRFSGPVIGAINGVAITGGFELALACDVLICSEAARFADTHARVGILPGWGLSQKLSRAIGIYPGQGAVAHRQLPLGGAGGRMGPRQPRCAGRRVAGNGAGACRGHADRRAGMPAGL